MRFIDPQGLFGAIFFGLIAVVFLGLALRMARKRRLLDDTPISKVLGVFIGEVQLEGQCVVQQPFTSYLTEKPSVMYRWNVKEEWQRWETETYQDKDGNTHTRQVSRSGWITVAEGGESAGFYLKDETGYLWVRPEGADIEYLNFLSQDVMIGDPYYFLKGPEGSIGDSTGRRRFFEEGIPMGTTLFVHGRARERKDIVAAEIAADPQAEMFVITPRKEKELSSGKNAWYWFLSLFGLAAACLVGASVSSHERVTPLIKAAPIIITTLLYLGLWTIGWVWMAFNSLVGLRNRVRQAQSLIDVQLKRRADLIPRLVSCLQGFRAHEAEVQTMVAQMRTATSGAKVNAVSPTLTALVEKYPDILAVDSFNQLKDNLVETENRLALAREYYNNIVTFFNTRLERVPDGQVAKLMAMQPAELFQMVGIERAQPVIKF